MNVSGILQILGRREGRIKQPFRIVYTLNGVTVFDVTVDQVTRNVPLASNAFTPPEPLQREAAPAAAAEKTPRPGGVYRPAEDERFPARAEAEEEDFDEAAERSLRAAEEAADRYMAADEDDDLTF